MKHRILLPALLALAASAATLADGGKPNFNKNVEFAEEGPWQEGDYQLPAYPAAPQWINVNLDNLQKNRIAVDAGSLSVGQDGVVRFILDVVSPGGVSNLSVEGIQCKNRAYRAYAFGDNVGKRWIRSTRAEWRTIPLEDRLRRELRAALCPDGAAPRDAGEAVASLRKNG